MMFTWQIEIQIWFGGFIFRKAFDTRGQTYELAKEEALLKARDSFPDATGFFTWRGDCLEQDKMILWMSVRTIEETLRSNT